MLSIRPRILLAACALIVPIAVACEPADDPDIDPFPMDEPAPAVDAPPPALETATDRYIAAWNADDPAAIARFYTEDATATVADDTYRGRAEIEREWLQNAPIISNLEVTETSSRQVGDDWQSEGTYTHSVSPPDAERMDNVTGRYSITWTRDAAGEWRIRSSDIQPDEPMEPVEG
jgi:uncharacterized protein (TIGR02246 family)